LRETQYFKQARNNASQWNQIFQLYPLQQGSPTCSLQAAYGPPGVLAAIAQLNSFNKTSQQTQYNRSTEHNMVTLINGNKNLSFANNGVLVNSVPLFLIHTQSAAPRRILTNYVALWV
jgi:hypothetical protein